MTPYPMQTISYRRFVKTAMTLGLRHVFEHHPDPNLRRVKVTLEAPTTQAHYPAVVVKFFGRNIQNVGVGSEQYGGDIRYQHYWYDGDISLEIHALDPLSVDYVSNTIVQTITVGQLETWTNQLFQQLYALTASENPDAEFNYLTVNSDKISEFGELKSPAPWGGEDAFVYQNTYRVGVMGEYYSVPTSPELMVIIEKVNVYPYDSSVGEPVPTGVDDSAPWTLF